MTASQVIHALEVRIKQHGDLAVYVPDPDGEESESAGIRYYEETEHLSECCGVEVDDDFMICPDCKDHTGVEFLPERFYIKI